jgi:hypothetical protein
MGKPDGRGGWRIEDGRAHVLVLKIVAADVRRL